MARYRVQMRVYDIVEVEVDVPEGCVEQDVIDQARLEAAAFARPSDWRVDEERVRVQRAS